MGTDKVAEPALSPRALAKRRVGQQDLSKPSQVSAITLFTVELAYVEYFFLQFLQMGTILEYDKFVLFMISLNYQLKQFCIKGLLHFGRCSYDQEKNTSSFYVYENYEYVFINLLH